MEREKKKEAEVFEMKGQALLCIEISGPTIVTYLEEFDSCVCVRNGYSFLEERGAVGDNAADGGLQFH